MNPHEALTQAGFDLLRLLPALQELEVSVQQGGAVDVSHALLALQELQTVVGLAVQALESAVEESRAWEGAPGLGYPEWSRQVDRIADELDDCQWAAAGVATLLANVTTASLGAAVESFVRRYREDAVLWGCRVSGVLGDVRRPRAGEEVPRG